MSKGVSIGIPVMNSPNNIIGIPLGIGIYMVIVRCLRKLIVGECCNTRQDIDTYGEV